MKYLGFKTVGEVIHSRVLEGEVQVDTFTTEIPLQLLNKEGLDLLNYWCVEDFDYAYIDRDSGCIVCVATHEGFLPEGYEPEELEE